MNGTQNPLVTEWNSSKQAIIRSPQAHYKIRRNLFLGRGGFGIVFVAIRKLLVEKAYTSTYDEVVLKEYKKSEKWQNQEDWDKQLVIFKKYKKQLQSDNILKIHEIFQQSSTKRYYLAMEYASGGSLFERVKTPMPELDILQFVKRSAQILKFLHYDALKDFKTKQRGEQRNDTLSLIHRDFKPANLVFKNKNLIKTMYLIDFGIAKVGYANIPKPFNNSGTNNYKAPQIYQVKTYNAKVDIYSFGCTLYEMFSSGQRLIGTIGIQKKYKERELYIKNKLIDLQFKLNRAEKDKKMAWPNFWLEILYNCLMHDPKDRWSSSELVHFLDEHSPQKYKIAIDYFGESSQQARLIRQKKEIYQINFEIYRLNLIQQRIFAIFEHLYFQQPRISKFMLYGILKYVIIFEIEKYAKVKEKCRLAKRDDKLNLVKKLFEDRKLDDIKKKALEKMKSQLEKQRQSNVGTASNERGHIEDMFERYPELLSETNPEPRRTLYEFCFQQKKAIMQDDSFAKMVALILIFMDELDWYPQLKVDNQEFERVDVEIISMKRLSRFKPLIEERLQKEGVKEVFEGCHIEVSLKSGMNRQQCKTDILIEPK